MKERPYRIIEYVNNSHGRRSIVYELQVKSFWEWREVERFLCKRDAIKYWEDMQVMPRTVWCSQSELLVDDPWTEENQRIYWEKESQITGRIEKP